MFEMLIKHPGGDIKKRVKCMSLEFREEVWGREIIWRVIDIFETLS